MARCKLFRVGRSRTGLGLFATTPVAKGMAIVEYKGRRLSTREAHERERRTGCKYMFELNGRWSIDGSSRRNPARYVNHACRPNAEFVLTKGKLMLRASHALASGDEITCDYGSEYFDLFIAPVGCQCATCVETRHRRPRKERKRVAVSTVTIA
jgi:SET domain-containing protein